MPRWVNHRGRKARCKERMKVHKNTTNYPFWCISRIGQVPNKSFNEHQSDQNLNIKLHLGGTNHVRSSGKSQTINDSSGTDRGPLSAQGGEGQWGEGIRYGSACI